jgi:uncharacterized YkwD family protein
MKKKMFFSIAAAATLLMANPVVNKADAAYNNNSVSTTGKVYVYQSSNMNQAEMNSIIQKYVKRYNINWNQVETKQPTTKKQDKTEQNTTQKPVQKQVQTKQPAQNKPATQTPVQKTNTQKTPAQTNASNSQLSAFEQQVVDLTNAERAKNGLPALKVDLNLSKVAREKSSDMQRNNYFSHQSPTYGSPFDMMKKFGITYKSAGENIAMGQKTPSEVVQAWMNSEGHRANILNGSYTHIGVDHVANGNYWTQQFIGK